MTYYGCMGMRAATMLLRMVRERKGISQSVLADAMGMSLRQIQRWEGGQAESVKPDALVRGTEFLGVRWEDVRALMLDDGAGEAEALAFAARYFGAEQEHLIESMTPEEIEAARTELSQYDTKMLLEELMRRQDHQRAASPASVRTLLPGRRRLRRGQSGGRTGSASRPSRASVASDTTDPHST